MRIGAAVSLFRSSLKTAESDRVQPFRGPHLEPPFKPPGASFQALGPAAVPVSRSAPKTAEPDRILPFRGLAQNAACRSVASPKTPPAVPWPCPKRRLPFRGPVQIAAWRQLPFRGPGHIASCRSVALSLAIISPAAVPWPCGPTGLYGGPMGPCNDPVGAL